MGLFRIVEKVGSKDGPHLLVTAAVHGDEYEGVEALRRLIREVNSERLTGRLTVVPVVNESAHGRGTREGEDGLDLARTFPGSPEGSHTERVAYELSKLIRASDYYIDLHSGGQALRVEPLVGYMLVSDPIVLDKQRRMANVFGLPTVWGTSSSLDGRSLSVARDAGVPAIYAEYLGAGECSTDGVEAYLSGCYNVMDQIGLISRPPVQSMPPERVIEDPRPSSGHLQIRHPSPARGVFAAYVALGHSVTTGAILGHVTGSSDGKRHPIQADSTGRVICLRVNPEVEKGDSLAVILEADPTMSKA